MALLGLQTPDVTGATVTFAAAAGGGDTVRSRGEVMLLVKNDDATPTDVTVARPGAEYGTNIPDVTFTVANGTIAAIGPIPSDFADPTDGLVDVTYTKVTSLSVAAIRFVQ